MKSQYHIYLLSHETGQFAAPNNYVLKEFINNNYASNNEPYIGYFDNEKDAAAWMAKLHPHGGAQFVVLKVYEA